MPRGLPFALPAGRSGGGAGALWELMGQSTAGAMGAVFCSRDGGAHERRGLF